MTADQQAGGRTRAATRAASDARASVVVLLTTLAVGCSATPHRRVDPVNPGQPATGVSPLSSDRDSSPALQPDSRVRVGKLDNGLTYFIEPHLNARKRVHLLLVVKMGMLHEDEGHQGLAHFVEHMAFSGTKRFPKQSLIDLLERSGLTFGADTNAVTLPDRTIFQLSVPSGDPTLVNTALDVLAEWAGAVTFDPAEVERERRVVLAELLSRRGADLRMGEQVLKLLLAGSRLAERSASGEKAGVERVGRDQLVGFYRRWYRPQRMAVIAVGDVESEIVAAAIEQRFGALAAPADTGSAPTFDIPVRHEPVAAVITDDEAPVSMVDVSFKLPSHPIRTEGDYRGLLVETLSSMALRHRLAALASSRKLPFAATSSSLYSGLLGRLDVMEASAWPQAGKARATLEALLLEIERVKRLGFSPGEIARAKQERARVLDHDQSGRETEGSAAIALALASGFISGNVTLGAEREKALAVRLLGAIDAAEVSHTVSRMLAGSEVVIVTGAARDALPSKDTVVAAMKQVGRRSVEPYAQNTEATAKLMSSVPSPVGITREQQIPEIGVTVWTLGNGAQVVLKHTDFKDDEILEQSVSFGGTGRVPAAMWGTARASAEIVAAGGVGGFGRPALNQLLSGKVVSVYPWMSEQDHGIRASASPRDVETMFQLIYLYTTSPRRDEASFDSYRASVRDRLRHQELIPENQFLQAIWRGFWGDDPRRLRPTPESVEQLNLDDALAFYRQRFADVSGTAFVFVGDLDQAVLRPLAERYLASLPGSGARETFHDLGLHRRKGVIPIRTEAGSEDKATVNLIYHGETPWSENAHTDLNSLRGYLAIRLREVLREQLGAVYTPTVQYSFERVPFDNYHLTVAFSCQPSQVDDLVQASHNVIERVKREGVAPGYIEKLKSMRTHDLEDEYRTNHFWLERLVEKFKMKEDPRQILILHDLTNRVTSENIQAAARRCLRDDQYVDARLLPAPKSPPSQGGVHLSNDVEMAEADH